MSHILVDTVTLTRGANGYVRAVRQMFNEVESPFRPGVFGYTDFRCLCADASVKIYSGNAVIADMNVLPRVGWDDNETAYLIANVTANIGGSAQGGSGEPVDLVDERVIISSHSTSIEDIVDFGGPQWAFDTQIPISFHLSGEFEFWADMYGDYVPPEPEQVFSAYRDDHSPFSSPTQRLRYHYNMLSLTLKITVGPYSNTFTITPEDYGWTSEQLNEIFGQGVCPAMVSVRFAGHDGEGYLIADNPPCMANLTIAGGPGATRHAQNMYPDYGDDGNPNNRPRSRYLNVNNNTLSVYEVDRYESYDAVLDITWDGGDVSYSGNVKHLDGTGAAGVEIETLDNKSASTNGSGEYELSYHYKGKSTYGWYNSYPNSPNNIVSVDDLPGLYGLKIANCEEINEPDYPSGNVSVSEYANYWGFNDSRIELNAPGRSWNNAVTFDASDTMDLYMPDVGDWAFTGCTPTAIADGFQITADTDDASLKRNSSSIDIRGWRLIDLNITADDTEDINATIAGREYKVKPGQSVVDVLNPVNYSGAASTAHGMGANPPACMGIGQIGEIQISGLRKGKTYTFKQTKVQRLPVGRRYIKAVIDPVFVGERPGDSRLTDNVAMFDLKPDWYISKSGVIVVDGVVAHEIFDIAHWDRGLYGWGHSLLEINNPDTIVPKPESRMCLSVRYGTSDEYYSSNLPATYLAPGIYSTTDSGSLSIPYRERVSKIEIPLGAHFSPTFTFRKFLRGGCVLQLGDTGPKDVTIKTLRRLGDRNPSVSVVTSNEYGTAVLPADKQPLVVRGIVTGIDEYGAWIVSGISGDYTGFEVFYADCSGATNQPVWATIREHKDDKMVVGGPPPQIGNYFCIIIDYHYEVSVDGGSSVTYKLRNHNMVFAVLAGVAAASGLLYHPDSGWLTFVPASGCLEYL